MNRRRGWFMCVLLLSAIVTSGAPLSDPATRDPGPRTRDIQVVAHPDDDILFMNPDLASGIRNGHSSISIYLTGGESDLPDPAGYAAQRQEGTRISYARMAGKPNEWNRTAVAVNGRLIEVDELRARPDVKLVFLNIPEDNNPGQRHAIIRLWEDPSYMTRSLVTASGTVRQSYDYRRADVIGVLAALFERFRPTSLRLQDPQPDPRYQQEWVGFHDHPDHVVGAHFATAAANRYMANPRRGAPLLHYRDYNVADAPVDLSAEVRARKKDYFSLYAERDSEAAYTGAYVDWSDRTYYRWPRGGAWAARDGAGRFHAFAVNGPWLQHWTRGRDGQWEEPRTSPVPEPLRPVVTALPDPRGNVVLVAQSLDGTRILLRRQRNGDAPPERFTPVDAPKGSQVGTASAVIDGRGRLLIAVQVADRGVCVRAVESERTWQCLGGQDVQDGVAAVLGPDRKVHLFASTLDGILHWQEDGDGGFGLVERNLAGIRPAGRPTAVRAGDRIRVFARTAGNGAVADVAVGSAQPPRVLPNPGGFAGPVAVAGAAIQVFARSSAGHLSAANPDGTWTNLGGELLDHPAAVTGPDGLVTLIALASDGRLLVNPQLPHAMATTFGGWRAPFPQSERTSCREQRADCG